MEAVMRACRLRDTEEDHGGVEGHAGQRIDGEAARHSVDHRRDDCDPRGEVRMNTSDALAQCWAVDGVQSSRHSY
ncbi:hypothetical protein JCM18899A_00110 [Nocardioides sp. AN3]